MTLVMSPSRFKWCPPHSCHCILRRREKWRDKWFLFGWWEVDYECGVNYYRENTVISPPVIFFCGCGGCVFKRCVAYTMEGDWLHFSKSRVQAAAVIGTVLCVFFPLIISTPQSIWSMPLLHHTVADSGKQVWSHRWWRIGSVCQERSVLLHWWSCLFSLSSLVSLPSPPSICGSFFSSAGNIM